MAQYVQKEGLMKPFLLSVLGALLLLAPVSSDAKKGNIPPNCAAFAKSLVGVWITAGSGYFEEMAFEQNEDGNVFNSWLHYRPEMLDKRWSVSGCNLRIYDPEGNPDFEFNYTIRSASKRRLVLVDQYGGDVGVYKRFRG
jgi:hypothetical protein